MISIVMYLDGQADDLGYSFIVRRDGMAWTAYKTAAGFKRFLDIHGLKIDAKYTQLRDMRNAGKGRIVTAVCREKKIIDGPYFWDVKDVPAGAKKFVDLCNGGYVDCYILDKGDSATVYRPNPNAKNVYVPYDHISMAQKIG